MNDLEDRKGDATVRETKQLGQKHETEPDVGFKNASCRPRLAALLGPCPQALWLSGGGHRRPGTKLSGVFSFSLSSSPYYLKFSSCFEWRGGSIEKHGSGFPVFRTRP